MSDAQYPLPQPVVDPKFTFGLISDVGKALAEHGYPPVTNGTDIVRLQQALFGFIYADEAEPAQGAGGAR